MGWIGHVAHMDEMRNVYRILARKPEGNRPGSSCHSWRIILNLILGK
jgi:hypothetical protein